MENVAKKRFVLGDHPGVDEVLPAALPGLDCGSSNPRIVAGNAVLDGPLFNPPPNRPARDPDSFTRETGASTLVECAACHELNP